MPMKVLIAIDCSPASERVLEEAAARPWPEGTTFGHVYNKDIFGSAKPQGQKLRSGSHYFASNVVIY
jgi:hypothetical protein